jgi:hypothetical protein
MIVYRAMRFKLFVFFPPVLNQYFSFQQGCIDLSFNNFTVEVQERRDYLFPNQMEPSPANC